MNTEFCAVARQIIVSRLGIDSTCELKFDTQGKHLLVRPSDFGLTEGFQVLFRTGWKSAEALVVPARFGKALIDMIGQADEHARSASLTLADALSIKGIKCRVGINNSEVPLQSLLKSWPSHFDNFSLRVKKGPFDFDRNDEGLITELFTDLVISALAIMISLTGIDETIEGQKEGNATVASVLRYERNASNREACIQLKGCKCACCGFDFSVTYGDIGTGYIEVHHIVPVSQLGPNYVIDINRDLVPLCSNCHSMVHRVNPPLLPEKLKELIQNSSGKADAAS